MDNIISMLENIEKEHGISNRNAQNCIATVLQYVATALQQDHVCCYFHFYNFFRVSHKIFGNE